MVDGLLNKQEYNKRLNDVFSKSQTKSLSETIQEFSCAANDFKNFSDEEVVTKTYSSTRLDLCPEAEQQDFLINTLDKIQTLVIRSIYEKTGFSWTWSSIYALTRDPEYAKVDKIKLYIRHLAQTVLLVT